MASFQQMRDRLPTLYRPEPTEQSLLTQWLAAIGALLDDAHADSTQVMQSHWVTFADSAFYSPVVARDRELADLDRLQLIKLDESKKIVPNAPDLQVVEEWPYIHDLARIGALLPAPPWLEPAYLQEVVESYRQRLARLLAIYKNGLGTVHAIRNMVEAQLPVAIALPLAQRDQPFWVEEFSTLVRTIVAAPTRGAPAESLGPLMRWDIINAGVKPVAPTIVLQAEAVAERPMIERYDTGLGLAHTGTLAAGEALRLQPAYTSWLATPTGLLQSAPDANPTAPGPWSPVAAGAPVAAVTALHQTPDNVLWVASNDGVNGTLWRFDGTTWSQALSGLAALHCLADDGSNLLLGAADGLQRVALFPADGDPFTATALPALAGVAVHAINRLATGEWWLATANGAGILQSDDSFVLSDLQGVTVFALYEESPGMLYFGTTLGLFHYQTARDEWYFYAGIERTEQAGDWQRFTGTLPAESAVGLPAVHAIVRSADQALWLGTADGLARYRARPVRGVTYETILEAYPDLAAGLVATMATDQRGLLWFGTDRGLFRYDGRQLWQHQAGSWVQLGHADSAYVHPTEPKPRGAWRYDRGNSRWLQFDSSDFVFDASDPTQIRSSAAETPVRSLVWVDTVVAEKGTGDGATFTPTETLDPATLQMRFKVNNERIVDGGIAALPRLPVGESTWRYLALEPADANLLPPAPAWTCEGRLLPPPQIAEAIPGRYEVLTPPPPVKFNVKFNEAVFAYPPVVRIWHLIDEARPLSVLVRLQKRTDGEQFDPVILDRVWQGIQQVRPAGVFVQLAVAEEIVRA